MAKNHPSGGNLPVRPAPAPPSGRSLVLPPTNSTPNLMDSWDLSFDEAFTSAPPKRNDHQPSAWPDFQMPKKKVPPPRPPPPKISVPKSTTRQLPARPKELIANLLRRSKPEPTQLKGSLSFNNKCTTAPSSTVSTPVATASLIDLSSPSSSPTPTTRSSSDGLSVDSFGSDGTASHSYHHSQVESGFEDDSDLIGGFTALPSPISRDPWGSSSSTPSDVFSPASSSVAPKYPWSTEPQDPFSPPRKFNSSPTPTATQSLSVCPPAPGTIASKPTIIRPKVKNGSPSFGRAKSTASPVPNFNDDGDDRSHSPPMPSIPPPAPPKELLNEMTDTNFRITSNKQPTPKKEHHIQGPHCVALYNYETTHAEDLQFKEGDVIELLEELSGDWLKGRIGNREGMFPANFVNVVVPLTQGVLATALYNFTPETWEDLHLQEGAKVLLLAKINEDWLFGESNGKRGQFPSAFVDNVPTDLPMRS